jgi:hypothetical protein
MITLEKALEILIGKIRIHRPLRLPLNKYYGWIRLY